MFMPKKFQMVAQFKSAKSTPSPPERLRTGFATMLKITSASKSFFDCKNRNHVDLACQMFLDSLEKNNIDLDVFGNREKLRKSLVEWAINNPNAQTYVEKTNKRAFFGSLRKKEKNKNTRIGSIIQHLNKTPKSSSEPMLNDANGGIEVVKSNSLSMLNTTVSSVSDVTYASSMADSISAFSHDKGQDHLNNRGEGNFSTEQRLPVIPESPVSVELSVSSPRKSGKRSSFVEALEKISVSG